MMISIPKMISAMALVMLVACSQERDSELHAEDFSRYRGNSPYALDNCYRFSKGNTLYKTAAGFGLSIPAWVQNHKPENQFNRDCELTDLKLHFAISEHGIVPVPHPGVNYPDDIDYSSNSDRLSLYLSFKDANAYHSDGEKKSCEHKSPVFNYPEYKLTMCPYLDNKKHPQIDTLPYYPRFEIEIGVYRPTSLSCRHDALNGYTVKNVYEMNEAFSCRGYWLWRMGAAAMYDVSLKNAYPALKGAERQLNAWVVEYPSNTKTPFPDSSHP